jgi:sugar phosphate isomerase/epimerase
MLGRRTFLACAAAAPLLSKTAKAPFELGVATYSLRKLSRRDAIAAIQKMGVTAVSVKEYHLRYDSTPEELAAGRKEFAAAGLKILSGGNIDLKGDEGKIRAMFEYARGAGMPMMVCAPSQATVPVVERMVKEYNIRVAIHNHGPEDKFFPTPQSVLEAIEGRDARMGLCIDIGHTTRTGVDVVESLRLAGKRLFDLHVKDLKDLKVKESQCIVGEGAMPMREIFATLKKMNYRGGCMLEYEIDADNPVPGMMRSFENMRRILGEVLS